MAKTSPLRYPGGKARLFKYFQALVAQNKLHDCHYVEPFCGGAALALEMLDSYVVSSVHLNDFDRAIYAFWKSAVENTDELCARIESSPISMETWHECREVYKASATANILDLGYSTFFLNRTNRSGILNAGVIGGMKQEGAWKLDARFNRDNLIDRIQRIGKMRSRITVTQCDAIHLLSGSTGNFGPNTLIYLDPPYVDKGPKLYLNAYKESDHRELASQVRQLTCPWVVSYDNTPLVCELYEGYQEADMRLHYSAREHTRIGREKVFFADQLSPPDMSGVTSRHRIPWEEIDEEAA